MSGKGGQDLYSSVRSNDSMMSRSLANGPHMSGVGIFFQQEPDGKVTASHPQGVAVHVD
jgi:hypothetical protein